jgi:hypothetical protein
MWKRIVVPNTGNVNKKKMLAGEIADISDVLKNTSAEADFCRTRIAAFLQ